LPNKY